MGAFEDLKARCEAQEDAARRRLGYGLLGAVVATPFVVWGGMWLERRRAHKCACKLPKGPSNLHPKAGETNGGNNNGGNNNGGNSGNGANGSNGGNGGNGSNGNDGNGSNGNGSNGNGSNGSNGGQPDMPPYP